MEKKIEGKLRTDLVPADFILSIAEVLSHGAKIYGDNEWKNEKNPKNVYYAAMMRHILAWRNGEELDEQTNFHHLECAACNLMFLLHFDKNE